MAGSAILDQFGRPIVPSRPAPRRRAGPVRVLRIESSNGDRPRMVASSTQPYEAASTDRIRGGWLPGLQSADADLIPNLPLIRARARDTARNGLGAGVIRTLVDHVIGPRGLIAQSRLDPELFGGDTERARRAEQQIEAAHRRWAAVVDIERRHDWASMQRLLCRSRMENGGVGINIVRTDWSDLVLEAIEVDRIETPPHKASDLSVRCGVERDAAGVPIAYWVTTTHPGDTYFRRGAIQHVRVPRWNKAGRPNFLLVFEQLRPGQTHGEPRCTPVIVRFDDRAEFLTAELFAAKTDAFNAYFITKERGMEEAEAAGEVDQNGEILQDIDYGAVHYLRPGEDIKTPENTRPGAELSNFLSACSSEIGAGIGVPKELISKDFSETTWHSARASSLELDRTVRSDQAIETLQYVRPIDRMVIENAILRGEVEDVPPELYATNPEGFLSIDYEVPVRGLVDPKQENDASKLAIELGISTRTAECAMRGRDFFEVVDQLAREEAYAKERNVSLGVQKPAPPGQAPPGQPVPDQKQESEETDDGAE